MITFKSPSDISKLPASDPAHPIIQHLIDILITAYTSPDRPYIPEDSGWIVLIEPGDTSGVIQDVGYTLTEMPWEGVIPLEGFFHAIFLANNEFGISFIIPDEPWVTGELREVLLRHLDP